MEASMAKFPTADWPHSFMEKLNSDAQYANIARNWEGDFYFVIEPGGSLAEPITYYFDLWHGRCREAFVVTEAETKKPAFILKAPYENFVRILTGELHPMQALMTRKLHVQGNMAVLMRNVPTVLDFVRCARENSDSFL
jgi:putative sterol carrier protein